MDIPVYLAQRERERYGGRRLKKRERDIIRNGLISKEMERQIVR